MSLHKHKPDIISLILSTNTNKIARDATGQKELNIESSYNYQLKQNSLSFMMIYTLTVNLKLRLENIKQGYTKNPSKAHDHSSDKGS